MPDLDDEVRIRVKKKEEELAPGYCIYPLTEQPPELPVTSAQLVYDGKAYTHWNTSESQRVQIAQGARVEASARVANESAEAYETLVMVGYNSDKGPIKLAESEPKVILTSGSYTFNVSFTMPNMSIDIVFLSYHVTGGGREPCLRDGTVAIPIYVAAEVEGDQWRNVEVGTPYLDEYAHEWKIPLELLLAPSSVYADAVLSDGGALYRFGYKIRLQPAADQSASGVYATTTYPEAYQQEGVTPYFHAFTPLFEDWPVRGMRGEVILSGDYPIGTAFRLRLQELDWELLTESWVDAAEQTIYLGNGKGGFRVSVSDAFFDSPYIWWWDGEQTVHCYECILGYVPGILLRVPVPNILVPPIEKVVKQGEAAEFTSADGLEEGKVYVFGIGFFHAVDQAVNGLIYESSGSVQEVHLVPVPGVGNSICPLLGVDPKSYECTLELAEFADPIYVANTLRKIVDHKDIAGNTAEPDTIDYIFLPIALLSGIIPAGTMGKKLAGPILKNVKKHSVVDTWIERNWIRIQAAVIRSDDFSGEVALERIREAGKAVEGSDNQKALLEEGGRILDDLIGDSKLTYKEVVQREKHFTDEIGKKLDDVGSETPAKEVVEKSGVKGAADYIPKLGKINIDDLDTLEKARRGARASKGTFTHEGIIYDIDKLMVKNGEITQHYKPRLPGLWNAMKRHRLITAGLFSWFVIMGPWFTIDNTQFIIYLLRAAGVLSKTWGDQWEDNANRRFDAYMQLKGDPCEHTYQAQLVFALEQLRELIDTAEPIPEDKIEKAKYVLSVLYGFDIGDPNEVVKAGCETDFDAWNHWYHEITRGCTAPLEPSFGFETTVYPKPRFQVKVESIVDGDTIWVSCTDEGWPHAGDIEVRVLGYDTPDKDTAGSTILGYSVRRKCIPETGAPEDPTTPVLKEAYYNPTTFVTSLINKQYVWLGIDPNNQTGSHGRLLATVEVDHEDYKGDLGEEMLRKGHAMVFFYTPNALMDNVTRKRYLAAETIARNAKLGVWSGEAQALPTGKIKCDSSPNNAYIYIDEETAPRDVTDTTLDNITIGDREVEFRGLTYFGVECKDCKCGYPVTVKEDERETVVCDMSAIVEVMQPKWEDENGVRWNVLPSIWLDDRIDRAPIGSPNEGGYPYKITFGKDYTGLGTYTITQNGPGLLARDCNHGEWTIEIRLDGYKALSSTYNIKPGMYKRLIPMLEKGTGDGGEIPEEEVEPEPEVGVGHLTINRPIIEGTATEMSGNIKVHIDGIYIRRYAGASTTRNIKCCTGCYCNTDKDLGNCSLGTHTLKLTKTGYEEWSESIVLEDGKTTEVTAEMTPADGTVTGAIAAITTEDVYAGAPSRFSATIVNNGIRTACYRMKFNFNGISPDAEGMYYEYPTRFEDVPDDGWSVSIEPGEEVEVSVLITLPADAIPAHAETARYDINTELQVAEIF